MSRPAADGAARPIAELLAAGPTFSFEFFPPRDPAAEATLTRTLDALVPLGPSFVSVTYGAGGSTRERTRDLVIDIQRRRRVTAMAHLTCVGHTRAEILELLEAYAAAGIVNILALAGDPPAEGSPPAGDFTYAIELVELIREQGPFSVGVAAHPEGHPRSGGDLRADRRHLAAKLEAADFAITQFFFDIDHYRSLVDELASLGCDKPVIPGVIPVTNIAQVERFAALAGAEFPPALRERLEAAEAAGGRAAVREVGIEVATELSARLLAEGAPGLHLYTLNRAGPATEIWRNLGLDGPGPVPG